MSSYTAAVVGLGSMGYGMALSLVREGIGTYGVDVRPDVCARFAGEGGREGTLDEVVADLDCTVIVVVNADQTEQVLFGEAGLVSRMRQGAVVIACATVPPDFARRMAERCLAHGVHYLDAPISGGAVKAREGRLSMMTSGTADAYQAAEPALAAMAETVFRLGDEAGQGAAMKIVNQMLAGTHIAAMAEAMTFGMTQGISPEQFMAVIPQCAGTSWMLENRGPHIVEGDYTPHSSVAIWPKDLGIALDIAKGASFGAPVTAAALQQFLAAAGSGLAGEDDAAVAKVYARNAGLALKQALK